MRFALRPLVHLLLALLVPLPFGGCASTGSNQPHVIDLTRDEPKVVADSSSVMQQAGSGAALDDSRMGSAGWSSLSSGGDHDGDGISDAEDRCPDEPEDRDGFQDADGCPEPDNDADGVLDVNDQCPNDPETKNGIQDEDGCPDGAIDRAKEMFRAGTTAYSQGDYTSARKYFEEAFKADPADALLYNLARTAEKQGDRNGACQYYRQWRATPMGASAKTGIASLDTCP